MTRPDYYCIKHKVVQGMDSISRFYGALNVVPGEMRISINGFMVLTAWKPAYG